MPVTRCPDCGKIISFRFPIHDCIIPIDTPSPPLESEKKHGEKHKAIVEVHNKSLE